MEADTNMNSRQLFSRALKVIPGGVNSPVRAFKSVGGTPVFLDKGKGSRVTDVEGNQYIDYVCSWGPLILGHCHPEVVNRVKEAAEKGLSFGAPCLEELRLAEKIVQSIPSVDMVRLVNSGTEASMSAIRAARAYTNKDKIIKFDGCYHGHSDGLLVKAGSGAATIGIPDSSGVPQSYTQNTLTAPYNDRNTVSLLFERFREDIAAIIVEPVAANMGLVKPEDGFLEGLRELADTYGAVLIFDEVITGFRLGYGGAQQLLGIMPDMTCLGKIIGGGMPLGAYGGKRDIMQMIAPAGPVYQAGTLSGNPVAAAAGLATLEILGRPGTYEHLEDTTAALTAGIERIINHRQLKCHVSHMGSLMTLFFSSEPVRNFNEAKQTDTHAFSSFFQRLLEQGIYWPPSQFEAVFISSAHTSEDIDCTLQAIEKAL